MSDKPRTYAINIGDLWRDKQRSQRITRSPAVGEMIPRRGWLAGAGFGGTDYMGNEAAR